MVTAKKGENNAGQKKTGDGEDNQELKISLGGDGWVHLGVKEHEHRRRCTQMKKREKGGRAVGRNEA